MRFIILLVYLAIIILVIVSMWKLFEKSGQEGWKAIIPIYNLYVIIVDIVKRPSWWIILAFIPFVNIIIFIVIYMDWAVKFGKSQAYGIGMALLGFIFLPMLAFSDATFNADARNDALDSLGDIGKQED